MTALYVPGTDEQDPKKLIMSQQLVAGQTSTNTTNIATLSSVVYNLKTLGAALDGVTDDTTIVQSALNAGVSVYFPPGQCKISSVTISNSKTKLFGASASLSVFTSSSANTPMITVGANLGNIDLSNFGLTRSVAATAGGIGLNFAGYVDTSRITNLEIQKQYVGASLSSTGFSEMSNCYVHDNIVDGLEITNTAGNGNCQWYLNDNLFQANGSRGVLVFSTAGPGQVTLGTWTNNYTFANSSFGFAFIGLVAVPINGVRLNGGFIGGDGNSEIYLDTYGGQHKIDNVFLELAGTGTTGPGFATAASGLGSGIEISANNTDITITNIVGNGNSVAGVRTLATQMTNICAGRFANNSVYGVLIADGTKAVLTGSSFNNNTTANISVTANAGSLIAVGNSPIAVNQHVSGYTAMTGSLDKATAYGTGTVTLAQLAGRVAQIQSDLTALGILSA